MNDKAVLAQWAKNLLNDDFFKEVIDNLKKEQISPLRFAYAHDVFTDASTNTTTACAFLGETERHVFVDHTASDTVGNWVMKSCLMELATSRCSFCVPSAQRWSK